MVRGQGFISHKCEGRVSEKGVVSHQGFQCTHCNDLLTLLAHS